MVNVAENRWIREYTDPRGVEFVDNLDGIDWYNAPRPSRWHRCKPQTRAFMSGGFVERCACGATRIGGRGPWFERNA